MVVGEDRQRYIAFVIEGGKTDRGGMIGAIRDEFSKDEYENIKPWLTVFEKDKGIVRCKHTGKERAIEILNGMQVGGGKVKTLTTSGTIKKAKKRLYEDERK
ncbi:MAG: hypothetical protein KGY76_01450 [Candidatus Thermoplasmatota archaeon]|nr:hypothetical protein [Candidatus Thermoplasmatota archaeon]